MCPVTTDEAVEPGITVEYEGKTIGFCCKNCKRKFLKSPETYLASLVEDANTSPDHDSDPDHHAGGETSADATEEHDHSAHGTREASPGFASRLVRMGGAIHPVVVHFPIGLLLSALLVEILGMLLPGWGFQGAARIFILIGAPAAAAAAVLGWAASIGAGYNGDLAQVLTLHRWLGISTAASALATLAFSEKHHRGHGSRGAYVSLLVLTAALVGVTGHLGGTLVFGLDHFSW